MKEPPILVNWFGQEINECDARHCTIHIYMQLVSNHFFFLALFPLLSAK